MGVGVGTGKIVVEEELKPGMVYKLPPMTVLNTGDEYSFYETGVTYHQDQPERRPPEEWFSFNPRQFDLEPEEGQTVNMELAIPVRARPGEYFAYIEGRPIQDPNAEGSTQIKIAAAAKLYFTVAPGNVFQGIFYRLAAFWSDYAPWTYVVTIIILAVTSFYLFKRFFSFELNLRRKAGEKKE